MTELRKLLQLDAREALDQLGTEPWLTVYSFESEGVARKGYFCALVPDENLEKALSHASWDLMVGNGMPGCSQSSRHGKESVTTDELFVGRDGVEPLVYLRDFHGIKPAYLELSEEFRHFHNLYHDQHNNRFIRILDSGEEEIVAEVKERTVRIRTRAIRQYLAVRRMHLLLFFDDVAQGDVDLKDIPEDQKHVERADGSVRYSLDVADSSLLAFSEKPFSRLLGKKAIPPLPLEQCGIWPYEELDSKYAEFIIGLDEHGSPLLYTCNPDELANYFGKNPDAPHFLTPVVFRREVLRKYYDQEKYSVEDGYLRCGGLWGLRMDNDAEDRVTVFLGDLGETLTYEEQLYWKSFNGSPEGKSKDLSSTNIKRSFLAEFADPQAPELVFKAEYTDFREAWEKQFGWPLIRPMQAADGHVFKRLHAPTTASASEFEDQVLLLTKLLVDSLNDSKLVEVLGSTIPDEKSIAKFERFLTNKSYPETRRDIEFLRLLQEARSGAAAHRKGDSYKRVASKLRLDNRTTGEVFAELLQSGIAMLSNLKAFFLTT